MPVRGRGLTFLRSLVNLARRDHRAGRDVLGGFGVERQESLQCMGRSKRAIKLEGARNKQAKNKQAKNKQMVKIWKFCDFHPLPGFAAP